MLHRTSDLVRSSEHGNELPIYTVRAEFSGQVNDSQVLNKTRTEHNSYMF
jgi:hypothetical protein